MITLVAIKKAINDVLVPIGLKTYGNEVKEGFSRPCFFVNLIPVTSDTFKKDTSENSLMIEIVYFSANKTDLENLQMYDTLKGILTPTLHVGTRNLLVKNFRAQVVDETDHIYSIKLDLNFYDEIVDTTPAAEPAQTVDLSLNIGGN